MVPVCAQKPEDHHPNGSTADVRCTSAWGPSAASEPSEEAGVGAGSLTGPSFHTMKSLGREGARWWHTNQMRKGGCRHHYIHWKQLCHKLPRAELKSKKLRSPNPITIRPCWALFSDSSTPCSRSVKRGFTSSLGVILLTAQPAIASLWRKTLSSSDHIFGGHGSAGRMKSSNTKMSQSKSNKVLVGGFGQLANKRHIKFILQVYYSNTIRLNDFHS